MWGQWPGCLWCLLWETVSVVYVGPVTWLPVGVYTEKQCLWSVWGHWPGCLWVSTLRNSVCGLCGASNLAACGVYTEKQCLWSMWDTDLAVCGCLHWETMVCVLCGDTDLAALGSFLFGWQESFTLNPVLYLQPFAPKLFAQRYLFFPCKKLKSHECIFPYFFSWAAYKGSIIIQMCF